MQCPTRIEIEQCLTGQLPEERTEALFTHYDSCQSCCRLVEQVEQALRRSPSNDLLAWALKGSNAATPSLTDSHELIARSLEIADPDGATQVAPREHDYLHRVRSIRDYDLETCVGTGGMGRVFRARHRHLQRTVAIKVLSPARFGNKAAAERFRREFQAVGQLDHPNIVRATDAGEHNGVLYLVMDWVEAVDLSHVLRRAAPLDARDAANVTRQVAQGLAYAHTTGLVHRDIKPSNVLMTESGRVRIVDFGLALLPQDASEAAPSVAGSIPYMAPEQFVDASRVGPLADVFGLGCTLFEMLAGKPLIRVDANSGYEQQRTQRQKETAEIEQRIRDARDIPASLRSLLQGMLHEREAKRPQASDVVVALSEFTDDTRLAQLVGKALAAGAPASSGWNSIPPSSVAQPASRKRKFVAASVVLLLGAAGWVASRTGASRPQGESLSQVQRSREEALTGMTGSDAAQPVARTPANRELFSDEMSHVDVRELELIRVEAWGKYNEHTAHVSIAPGRGATVQLLNSDPAVTEKSVTCETWDLLDLKIKHPEAFAVYEVFGPALSQAQKPWEYYPFAGAPATPVERTSVRFRTPSGEHWVYQWDATTCTRHVETHGPNLSQ